MDDVCNVLRVSQAGLTACPESISHCHRSEEENHWHDNSCSRTCLQHEHHHSHLNKHLHCHCYRAGSRTVNMMRVTLGPITMNFQGHGTGNSIGNAFILLDGVVIGRPMEKQKPTILLLFLLPHESMATSLEVTTSSSKKTIHSTYVLISSIPRRPRKEEWTWQVAEAHFSSCCF